MLTLASLLQRAETHFGDRTAIINTGATWRGHVKKARQIAKTFNMKPGMRFAIIAPNCVSQAELLHAGYLSGAVPVPVNWRLSPPEILVILENSSPDLIFLGSSFSQLLSTPILSPHLKNAVVVEEEGISGGVGSDPELDDTYAVSSDDTALLLYTGGTSGAPKGVPLTHGNIIASAFQIAPILEFSETTRYLHLAPSFHAADLLATAVTMLGGSHAFLDKFDQHSFVEYARNYAITATMLAPAVVRELVNTDDVELPDLKMLIYGSSPMDAALLRETCKLFPAAGIRQGYGLTETSPLISILGASEHRAIAAGEEVELTFSAGRPLPGVDLRVTNTAGQACSFDVVGEIEVRGPNVFHGYFQKPTETKEAFNDGWFRTGDIGRINKQGYLFLMDRAKDMIITGGENVYSIQVEDVLLAHSDVVEAAVIGLPHPKWGEEVTAVLVTRNEGLTTEIVREHCRAELAGYKIPRRVIFVDRLPRSALGKVLKHELRASQESNNGR
ncbi:MAG: AMP-binding protein [Pseudomonadales bacterium]